MRTDENLGNSSSIGISDSNTFIVASTKNAIIYKVDISSGKIRESVEFEDVNAKIMSFTILDVFGEVGKFLMTRDHNGFNLVNLKSNKT